MTDNNDDITLRDAQATVDNWITTVGVRYFSPLTNMAVLAEEVGEVARIMARRYGDQSFKEGERDTLGDELADVMWVVMAIAIRAVSTLPRHSRPICARRASVTRRATRTTVNYPTNI